MDYIQNLHKHIEEASRIIVVVHTHPDGDAIGSGLGMLNYLRVNKKKEAFLVLPDAAPDSLSFMLKDVDNAWIKVYEDDAAWVKNYVETCDLIIGLDFNSFKRTEAMSDLLKGAKTKKVLIDHHLEPESEAFDLVISKADISSASELLYWTLKQLPDVNEDQKKLPFASLTSMMTGMTTDTNNFANSVYPSTFQMASELLEAGVDRSYILSSLYNQYRENRLRLQGFLLEEKMKITEDGVAFIIVDKQTQEKYGMELGETEGFVNIPLGVAKVRMSIFLKEDDSLFRVSIRSKVGTSANKMANEYFNGGGHEQAAGGKLVIGKDISDYNEAEAYILKVTHRFFAK